MLYLSILDGNCSVFCITDTIFWTAAFLLVIFSGIVHEGHITVTDAGFIYLTESGKEIADMIYERHELLSSWLMHLGVPEEIATEDACKMEHVISKESFEAIKKHVGVLS